MKLNKENPERTEEMEIVDLELTEEAKTQTRIFEDDIIGGLIAAADFKKETQRIEIIRNGTLFFSFQIQALTEEEYDRCKRKHTKYVRNKHLGMKLPEDTNSARYRCELIYQATTAEDRKKLWDNRKAWDALIQKEFPVINGLDVIENTLKSGEKDKVIDCIDNLSGYEDSNLEEVAKN